MNFWRAGADSVNEEQIRKKAPLDWAMTPNNLGAALGALGAREADPARLQQAVLASRRSPGEQVSLELGRTQNDLGIALEALEERESDTARLEEAASCYNDALAVFRGPKADYDAQVTERNYT